MKKTLISSLVFLALVIVPFTAKASAIDDLWKIVVSLQQQLTALIKERKANPVDNGWQVYKNDQYGFEISLPKSWEKVESLNQDGTFSVDL
jgi:hypothetical protein